MMRTRSHQMDLFSDRCADLLTEHLQEGSVFIHDRETRWHYSTHMIGTRKANYRAILQCCYYTFEEVVDQVDALAPRDTIPLDISNCQHVVEIVWPNRPREQEYFMDVWDDQDSTPILDASVAKTALQTAGFKPTDVMHAASQKHAKMFRTGWIATLEVETLQMSFDKRSSRLSSWAASIPQRIPKQDKQMVLAAAPRGHFATVVASGMECLPSTPI